MDPSEPVEVMIAVVSVNVSVVTLVAVPVMCLAWIVPEMALGITVATVVLPRGFTKSSVGRPERLPSRTTTGIQIKAPSRGLDGKLGGLHFGRGQLA